MANKDPQEFVERDYTQVPLDEALRRGIATVRGAGSFIPGYDALTSALAAPLSGVSVEESARNAAQNTEQNPGSSLLGLGLGTIGLLATGGVGAAADAAEAPSLAAKLASAGKAIAKSSGIGAAIGAGNLAFHRMFEDTPLTAEKAIFEVGIPTLIGAGAGTLAELPGVLGAMSKKYGTATARRILRIDPSDTRSITEAEGMAKEALGRDMLDVEGAEAARRQKIDTAHDMEKLVQGAPGKPPVAQTRSPSPLLNENLSAQQVLEQLKQPAKYTSKIADELEGLSGPVEKVSLADPASRTLAEDAARIRNPSTTWKELWEIQKAYAARARTIGDNPATLKTFNAASEFLRDELEKVAPGFKAASKEYGFLEATSENAQKAASAPMGVRMGTAQVPLPIPNAATRAQKAYDVGSKLLDFDKALEEASSSLFGKTAAKAMSVKGTQYGFEAFKELFTPVEKYRQDPSGFNARLHADLEKANLPPAARDTLHIKGMQAIDFLNQVAPKNPHDPTPNALPWEPSMSDQHKFVETYKTLAHPPYYFSNPTEQGAAAIKAVYPEIMNEMNTQAMRSLVTTPEMSQTVKSQVNKATGIAMDATQNPLFGARMQMRLQEAKNRAKQNQAGSARNKAAQMKQDKATMTRAQRIEQLQSE